MGDVASNDTVFTPGDPRKPWHWHPQLPLQTPPVLVWPPQPLAFFTWLFGRGILLSQHILFVALAAIAWIWTPSLERMTTFEAGWILEILVRNLVLFGVFTAALHLWFHTFRAQGDTHKFDPKPLEPRSPKFLFHHQLGDNVFWSLISGIPIVTAYEVAVWWCWANGYIGWFSWADGSVWFIALFFVVLLFESAHFYFVHRLLHWKPFYRFHDLHHNNVNVGPWSGLAMHPAEHVIYLSSMLLHLVIATHPLHMLYHSFFLTAGASTGHTGYHNVDVKGRNVMEIGNLFHQLHHRYYNCNYGQSVVPLDKCFGSFHDGTAEATTRIMKQTFRLKAGAPKANAG